MLKKKKSLVKNITFYENENKTILIENKKFINKRKIQREMMKQKSFLLFIYILIFLMIANLIKIGFRYYEK